MTEICRVISVSDENYDTKTISFCMKAEGKPGQFVMVSVPGSEEVPMSLSGVGSMNSITVKRIGPDTEMLHKLQAGDPIRIRGPYGNGYSIDPEKKYLAVGGGVGTASILPAAELAHADVVIGGRTKDDIIMRDRASRCGMLLISTDDGSEGFHGNAVELAKQTWSAGGYDCVIACGPPVMLKFLYKACAEAGIPCQLSLERYMKCGAGVCGCCVIDGLRVCKDGPVFSSSQIPDLKDFGTVRRDACGRIIR